MEFLLERPNANKYSTDSIVDELRRVAAVLGNKRFTRHEFDREAKICKGSVVLSRFGSWQAALNATGIKFADLPKKDRTFISNDQLFFELERIWRLLGHRPSKDEWEHCQPCYSYTTYKTRFGGWINACAAFIEHKTESSAAIRAISSELTTPNVEYNRIPQTEKRTIRMKLRYRVLARDKFKCVSCGRSPATHSNVVLHIDHIIPFSQGGETVLDNLRTLCQTCNWGKGSDYEQ